MLGIGKHLAGEQKRDVGAMRRLLTICIAWVVLPTAAVASHLSVPTLKYAQTLPPFTAHFIDDEGDDSID